MSIRAFLKDKLLFFVLQLFFLTFLVWMLHLFHATVFSVIYLLCLYFILLTLALGNEYFKKKNFYETALSSMDALDKKFMLSELLDRPGFLEGGIFYDCLTECNKSMCDEVSEYKVSAQDYREYVEMWIHEVKTPIAASRLMIENNPSQVTKDISDELEEVEYYLEQALYYSRSNGVEKDYIVKRMNLNTMVQDVIKKNSKLLIQSKVKISLDCLDYDVYTDEKWMEFIIKQIVINSVKYRKENPEIRFAAEEDKDHVTLLIGDNGIGISSRDLPKVMEKGYTGTTGRKYAKSTGMGLYLCRKLSDKLGIGFSIRSIEGEGTQVKIEFPKNSFVHM
ncbi:ATP-binding protein [Anaerostipes sp.]|uniref:ATP-binding protein n=1 Tax=Anaerostipes sp. TaxID=1872530 RepID=UPI0025BC8931|nr:ATP-binding protein [Anaerostipes sp.]MBS7009061.1 sensor histidine kinase [Anaerostipes sp.]